MHFLYLYNDNASRAGYQIATPILAVLGFYLGIFEWEEDSLYRYHLTASRSSRPSHGSRDRTSCSCWSRTPGHPGTQRHRHAAPRPLARHSHPHLGGQPSQKHFLTIDTEGL